MTDRRRFVVAAGSGLLSLILPLPARVAAPPRRIGLLSPFPRADVERIVQMLRVELEKVGWVDGRNLVLMEPHLAEGRTERLSALARDLVALRPDVILVQSAPATRALMAATSTIPIVMIAVGNPVEYGIVTDYKKPGGNITGAAYLADESIRKLVQILKEAVPRLRSIALFANPGNEGAGPMTRQMRLDAAAIGMRAHVVEVVGPADFERAFAAILREQTESIVLPPEPLIRSHRDEIGAFALRHRLPLAVVGGSSHFPATGGLVAFAPASSQYPELAARYIDQLLKGRKPGDLPIEQPTRFELAVNLKTAHALGITLPPTLLASADEVLR